MFTSGFEKVAVSAQWVVDRVIGGSASRLKMPKENLSSIDLGLDKELLKKVRINKETWQAMKKKMDIPAKTKAGLSTSGNKKKYAVPALILGAGAAGGLYIHHKSKKNKNLKPMKNAEREDENVYSRI